MQMAMVINMGNLLIHNKQGDERNIGISRVDRLIKPSSMKYAVPGFLSSSPPILPILLCPSIPLTMGCSRVYLYH